MLAGGETVYNFEVEEYHTYFVGGAGAWVHNESADPCEPFPNQFSGQLDEELARAERLGVRPIRAGEAGFEELVNQGTIKFVVTTSGELIVGPHSVDTIEISHAVLSRGESVLAAGQADIAAGGGRWRLGEGVHGERRRAGDQPARRARRIVRRVPARPLGMLDYATILAC